jgi:hypothetical protein
VEIIKRISCQGLEEKRNKNAKHKVFLGYGLMICKILTCTWNATAISNSYAWNYNGSYRSFRISPNIHNRSEP